MFRKHKILINLTKHEEHYIENIKNYWEKVKKI